MLANGLKNVLEKCISDNQSVFGQLYTIKSKVKGKIGYVAIKLDIGKAYDKIDGHYLRGVITKMSFSHQWMDEMDHDV